MFVNLILIIVRYVLLELVLVKNKLIQRNEKKINYITY